mmetsp:Transcript_12996/g.40017  ORF Transcript_12996/g.40017 Transcript_12996/m.40017 type:complete len:225 (+) Transcript_12996:482-1156(+)
MTSRLYFEDSYRFVDSAAVTGIEETDDGLVAVRLNRTIFHPQGGGQPSDTGTLDGKAVVEVKAGPDRTEIVHYVKAPIAAKVGDEVELRVDEAMRRLHARVHSAGHLLDVVIKRLALPLVPGKGYHHPAGSYVEFVGQIPAESRVHTLQQIQNELDFLLRSVSAENSTQVCIDDSGVRTVRLLDEDDGTLCGGTHVKHVTEIGACKVTKLVKKQKNMRLCYVVS